MQLLYFAWVRESVGVDAESVDPPASVRTLADLVAWLRGRSAGHAAAFADLSRVRAALDQRFAPMDAPIGAAREVAFFPPVSGG